MKNYLALISQISAFLGEGVDTITDEVVQWHINKNGEYCAVEFDSEKKVLNFIDWGSVNIMDSKTYYAIIGLAKTNGIKTRDLCFKI